MFLRKTELFFIINVVIRNLNALLAHPREIPEDQFAMGTKK